MACSRAADCGVALAPLTPDAHLAHLARASDAFAACLETGDLDAPVPGCPGWRLTDLAHHLGGIHRWARAAVVDGTPTERNFDGPVDRGPLVGWVRAGATELVETLRATDPATPCWTFGSEPRTAAFWFRRQAHETVMHTRDAAASQGVAEPVEPDVALDGIDEIVTMFFPRQVRLGRTAPLDAALALAPDEGGRWVVAGDGTDHSAAPDATVSGPAAAVLLLLWHRVELDDPRLTISGSRAAADDVLAAALTP
jgi:uncharacterized protein (TIGR03083 family)